MFSVNIPITTSAFLRTDRNATMQALKEAGVNTVLLSNGSFKVNPAEQEKELADLKLAVDVLKAEGFDVGCWYWTFLIPEENTFEKMVGMDGKVSVKMCCPMDEAYIRFVGDYVSKLIRAGVSLILFDDDFRYGHLDMGLGCLCPKHMQAIHEKLGEQPVLSDFVAKAFTGGENRYRDAWLSVRGDALRHFAAEIRSAVDAVDPAVRVGICSCITSWGVDGVEATELAEILAGQTNPYLRLIGAPYWAVHRSWGNRLGAVIETARMEAARACGKGIEVYSEGDSYPRPRHACPASYLELFDLALLADGKTDGIMKYLFDYTAPIDYELGYLKEHQKNASVRKRLIKFFEGKEAAGLRVYEYSEKLKHYNFGPQLPNTGRVQDMLFSHAARFISENSIPTVYEGEESAGIVFGSNAALLPESALENGLILDAMAADILTRKGVDVGIQGGDGALIPCTGEEFYIPENQYIRPNSDCIAQFVLDEKVQILSKIVCPNGTSYPTAYRYENENGQRFLVYLIDAATLNDDGFYRNYARQRQLTENIQWLQKKPLPVICNGHPDLYILCSRKGNHLSVGLWNLSADAIVSPEITVCEPVQEIRCIRCAGTVNGNMVRLSTTLHAFEFAAFEVVL